MKKYDVVALGELLIDFTESGVSEQGNQLLEANPGGAPCNVLAMLGKLGNKTAFIGKVGDDVFGNMLERTLEQVGIKTSGLIKDKIVNTTLAFVHTKEDGDRDFSFYRNPGADMMLTATELNRELLNQCRIFHYGSLSMTATHCREATRKAIKEAKRAGAILSFDPNLREPLWDSLDEAKEQIEYGLKHCDILKISDNEIEWLTGEKNYDKAVLKIREHFSIQLILVSMGKDGSRAYYKENVVEVPAFIQADTIETTGAGDTFMGCVLHKVLEKGLENLQRHNLEEVLLFANAAASIVTTRKGALRVMPKESEIQETVKRYQS